MPGFRIAPSAFFCPGASHLTLTGEAADVPICVVRKAVRGRLAACLCLMDAVVLLFGLFVCTESGFFLFET